MWPFKSNKNERPIADTSDQIAKHIAEVLAPDALPSAREKALVVLMALPQNLQTIECYSQIALDPKQVWKVRHKAVEGIKLSVNADGARALLRCVASDLRRVALSDLCKPGFPEVLRQLGPEAQPVLAEALRQISRDAEAKFSELLLTDLGALRQLLSGIATPEAKSLLPHVHELYLQSRNRLVPKFLERALKSKYHLEVKEAVAALERLDTAEAKAALENFRSIKSRLVEKDAVPGVGCPDESCKLQVYTSEFGQPKCEEELALAAARLRDWELRHPPAPPEPVLIPPVFHETDNASPDPAWVANFTTPTLSADNSPPPEVAPVPSAPVHEWPVESSQYYAAASARGIEEELLALVADHLEFLQSLHRLGSLAPLAAVMDHNGEINGMALTTKDPGTNDQNPEEAIRFFQEKLQADARQDELLACAIFYHGCHGPGKGAFNVAPAQTVDTADCIVALLDHRDGQAVTCVIQYTGDADGGWKYAPACYAPKQPNIFVDPIGTPLAANRALAPQYARRPAAATDHGTHPELMTLVESQLELLKTLQRADSLAPVVATMQPCGEIQAALIVNRDVWESRHVATDTRDPIVFYPQGERETTPGGTMAFFIEKLRLAARHDEIVASAIFFHAIYEPEAARLGLQPAKLGEVPDCLVAQLDHRMSQAISLVIRYSRQSNGMYHYAAAEHHSAFPLIFNSTRLPNQPL